MKRRILIFLIMLLSFSIPLFAEGANSGIKTALENLSKDSTEASSIGTTLEQKTEEVDDEISDKQNKKQIKSTLKNLRSSTKRLDLIASWTASSIEGIMTRFENIIMSPFKVGKNDNAMTVFNVIMAIFLVLSMAYYVIEIVVNPQFQMREIPILFFKCLFLVCAFYFLPQMARVLKNFAWKCAEIITSSPVKMEYSVGTRFINSMTILFSTGTGVGLVIGSYFAPAVSSLTSLAWGLGFAGYLSVLSSTLIYCTWVLELYIATYVLAWYLPSCIFKGFNYNMMNVMKFYFVNTLEVFVGAVVFLIVLQIPVGVGNASDGTNILSFVASIIKPLIVAIFLPAVSKIIGAITSGNSLADTSGAAGGAFRRMAAATGIGATAHKVGGLISGGKKKRAKAKQEKATEELDEINRDYNNKKSMLEGLGYDNNSKVFDELKAQRKEGVQDVWFKNLDKGEKERLKSQYGEEGAKAGGLKELDKNLKRGNFNALTGKK